MTSIFPIPEDPSTLDLSIIIVSWNVCDFLQACLQSIDHQTHGIRYEVFVVDNASHDQSAAMVRQQFPEAKLMVNETNRGFAAACNQALRMARGRMLLLLNPDTVILDRALEKMVDWMDQHPKVGILGPTILHPDLTIQPSTRTFPTLGVQLLILLKLHHVLSFLPPVKAYFGWNHPSIAERVDQVMGACFLIRRETFQTIGYLDEQFWIWFEEVDYCKRASEAGWETWSTPTAQVMHQKGQSFQQLQAVPRQRLYNQSLLRYFRKHHSPGSFIILKFLAPVSLFLAALIQFFNLRPSIQRF
jgi:GT2 family glycosyltransferase